MVSRSGWILRCMFAGCLVSKQRSCCHDVHTRVDMTLEEEADITSLASSADSEVDNDLCFLAATYHHHPLLASPRLALPQACTPVPTSLSTSGHRGEKQH